MTPLLYDPEPVYWLAVILCALFLLGELLWSMTRRWRRP